MCWSQWPVRHRNQQLAPIEPDDNYTYKTKNINNYDTIERCFGVHVGAETVIQKNSDWLPGPSIDPDDLSKTLHE